MIIQQLLDRLILPYYTWYVVGMIVLFLLSLRFPRLLEQLLVLLILFFVMMSFTLEQNDKYITGFSGWVVDSYYKMKGEPALSLQDISRFEGFKDGIILLLRMIVIFWFGVVFARYFYSKKKK